MSDRLAAHAAEYEWEKVLKAPPEVEAVVMERYERTRLLRDGTPSVVYLAFEGVTIYKGNDSDATTNTSWIPEATTTFPAFDHTPFAGGMSRTQTISTIVSRLEQVYAGYHVTFTTTRPSSGNYMMTVIGGRASLAGQPYGVLGVSPLDCYPVENLNPNPVDIDFIFAVDIGNVGMSLWDLVYVIAHENAHTYGLAHINRQTDIMYYATMGGAQLTWGAAATRSGESNCSSTSYQDDALYLTKAVGGAGANAETTPPTVTITSPVNGATVGSGFTVNVTASDASGVKDVELWVNGAFRNSLPGEPYSFTMLGMEPGSYQLQAKAHDWYDNLGTSSVVNVVIPGGQPVGCQSDAECGPNMKCQDGTCVALPPPPVGGVLGSDCVANEECQSGWCIMGEQSYCTQACNEANGVFCPAGYYCSPDGFCLSSTYIPPGAVGAPCTMNVDCRTEICVDGENNGYCSAVCFPDGEPCPNQVECIDSGDGVTFICGRVPEGYVGPEPPTDGGGGGCTAAPGPHGGLMAALFLLVLGRRRRRYAGRGRSLS